jgi:hypothetical protein
MRSKEFLPESVITESRGVTARDPGQTYVNDTNPGDILTVQSVDIITPPGALQFETTEEMLNAVDQSIPPGAVQIDDNKPTLGTGPGSSKAAIIATVINASKQIQCWVRYVKAIPPTGPHTLWQTLRGYKFSQGSKEESIPIKPADIILDDRPRSAMQLAKEIKVGVANQVNGTQYQALAPIMTQAVDLAVRGQTGNIKGGAEYSRVVGKYGGEYLGPIAVIQGGVTKGDIAKMMQTFKIDSLAGTTIRFPQSKEEELIDSIFTLPNGTQLNVSTKIHKGGGAASSLSGVAAQLTDEITEKFPTGSMIIDTLGTMSAVDGPLFVAQQLGILNNRDINDFNMISKSERNIRAITNPKLFKIVQGQGYLKDAEKNPAYRVFYHALTAIVNQVIKKVNAMPEFHSAMLAALNNNNYLQLVTDVRNAGKDITIDYYGKFPAVFQGRPEIRNKAYFVTGQKGRLGFKLV